MRTSSVARPVLTLDYKAYSISMVVDTDAVQSFVSEEIIGRMKKQYRNITTGYRQTPSASGLGHDNDYLIDGLTFNGMPVGRMKIISDIRPVLADTAGYALPSVMKAIAIVCWLYYGFPAPRR